MSASDVHKHGLDHQTYSVHGNTGRPYHMQPPVHHTASQNHHVLPPAASYPPPNSTMQHVNYNSIGSTAPAAQLHQRVASHGHISHSNSVQNQLHPGQNLSHPSRQENGSIDMGVVSSYVDAAQYHGLHNGRNDDENNFQNKPALNKNQQMEDELGSVGRGELLRRTLRSEGDLRDMPHKSHSQVNDIRHVKDQLQRLSDDNQELRDLCCFLDDDRQKGRKLAREWQRFGRYTASVMRQEVTAYQNKLRELDTKQQELIKDNLELKELCLYLDEERNNAVCSHCGHPVIARDDGDGSSSSTNADEPSGPPARITSCMNGNVCQESPVDAEQSCDLPRTSSRERLLEETLNRHRSPFNAQVLTYIRSLESRIMLLETEKQQLGEQLRKVGRALPEEENKVNGFKSNNSRPPQPPPYSLSHHLRAVGLGIARSQYTPGSADSDDELLDGPPMPPIASRPAAVAAAMRVLEVQEQLDGGGLPLPPPDISCPSTAQAVGNLRPSSGSPHPNSCQSVNNQDSALADGEKALLRQMCNVVWRKLEEVPSQPR